MVVATGMQPDSEPSTSRDTTPSPPADAEITPAGTLSTSVLQILIPARTVVNEEGEIVEEEQPPLPTTLAPAFSRETLDALRAERMARRAASSSPPQQPASARSATPTKGLKSLTSARGDGSPMKAAKSHRANSNGSSTGRSSSSDDKQPKKSKAGTKSSRGGDKASKKKKEVRLTEPSIAEMIELEA